MRREGGPSEGKETERMGWSEGWQSGVGLALRVRWLGMGWGEGWESRGGLGVRVRCGGWRG